MRPSITAQLQRRPSSSLEEEMAQLEQQVLASAREKMDYNQITRALFTDDDDASIANIQRPTWQIALTAATVFSVASLWLFGNVFVTMFVFGSIFVVANADPLHADDDNLWGALARLLGRATLQSYTDSKPRMKALARAVVTGQDQVRKLQQDLEAVLTEIEELRTWKQRRLWVEDHMADFTVDDLKDRARNHGLAVGGTKIQLLQRLVDANVIAITAEDEGQNSWTI
jgi:hypothetical protein